MEVLRHGLLRTALEFDGDGVYLDFVDSRNGIEEWTEDEYTAWMCAHALSVITDLEREVIDMYFGLSDDEPRSYDEIAQRLGISRKRVPALFYKALRKMRHPRVWLDLMLTTKVT